MGSMIHLSDLRTLGKVDRESVLGRVVAEAVAPTNGQAYVIKSKIQAYESRYEMTSAEMRQGLQEK